MSPRTTTVAVRTSVSAPSSGRPPAPPQPSPSCPDHGDLASAPPAAIIIVDAQQRICQLEGDAFAVHGRATTGLDGLTLREVLPAEAFALLRPRYEAALSGIPQSFDYPSHDGTRRYRVQMAPVREGDGVSRVVVVVHDDTERRQVAAELARSQARLQEAERMVGIGSWELVVATGEITFSPGLARLYGLPEDAALDTWSHLERVHPDDRELVHSIGERCVVDGSMACEYRIIRPDGSERLLSLQAEAVSTPEGWRSHLRGAALDITEQRAAQAERLAVEDLFRQGFDAAPIGMILSDPEEGRCLRVNDAMCELLQRTREDLLGSTIACATHPEDRPPVLEAKAAMARGERAGFQSELRFLRADGTVAWGLLHITPVRRADGTLAAFHSQLADITERHEREAQLQHDVSDAVWLGRIRDALDEDRLLLYSQPIVDLVTGETVQHELLLRMRGEDGTIIAPAEFLPAAERYGLISEIDRWVIRQAVASAAAGTPTEFNLSGRSMGDPAIVRELADALAGADVDPSLLVVEVTETALVGNVEAGREFAEQVRALGCRVALDDFGTGFSSLSYLKHFPADHLKIDIEFVRELTASETDARVVRGIVGLAREFNQTTIAEGVEDEATLLMLRELGVDRAQGYLFGRPAPRDEETEGAESPRRAAGCGAGCGAEDPVAVVREAFDAFAARDVPRMLAHCRPDVILRSLATSRLAERQAPYRGHEGLLAYMRDVAAVWDELTMTVLTIRRANESVIGFGRADGRRPGNRMLASLMWIVRLEEGQIASMEVFQAVGNR